MDGVLVKPRSGLWDGFEKEKKTRIDLDPTKAIRWQYIIVTREPGEMPPFGWFYFTIYSIP